MAKREVRTVKTVALALVVHTEYLSVRSRDRDRVGARNGKCTPAPATLVELHE